MVPGPSSAQEEAPNLSGARADFVATLGRRVSVLRSALSELEADPRSSARRDTLLRRVHAMGAAARVLGFEAVADALAAAEKALHRGTEAGSVSAADLADVSRALDQLPALAWGAGVSVRSVPGRAEGPEQAELQVGTGPLSVLLFGAAALGEAIEQSTDDQTLELERTEDPAQARALCDAIAPDVVILDADRRGAHELATELSASERQASPAMIVVGSFDQPDAASVYVALGVERVLPKPVSPDTLRRTVLALSRRPRVRTLVEPIGEVTVGELGARIVNEVQRGLIEAVEPGGQSVRVPLGDGSEVLAAVWGAVARVRELCVMRTNGEVRFDPAGPEGAVPLAAFGGEERRNKGDLGADRTQLKGRRALVVDDDPAVVWFISGLLGSAGMQVIEAHDGEAALELVLSRMPDVVVSDVLMPGIDGLQLCREIKRDVAVRDVPVILLSWKEDLLARMRELGADADGYLRKEATGNVVIDRVSEVLAPRARVEARLAAGGEVRGRLEGLTTRLLLELCERHRPSCQVTIRDAAYLYELELVERALASVTRTSAQGSFERGERVLASLLGVSDGRFVVSESSGAGARNDQRRPLQELWEEPIRRARAAQRALRSETLMRVDRIEIDREAIAAYLPATPAPVARLIERLADGEAPRDLILSGEASGRVLETVLSDVIRRGAVVRVLTGSPSLSQPPEPPPPAEAERDRLFTFDLGAPIETDSIDQAWTDGGLRVEPYPPKAPDPEERAAMPLSRTLTPPIPAPPDDDPEPSLPSEPKTRPGVGPIEVRPIEPEPASFQLEASSAPRLEVEEMLDESFAELSERESDDEHDDQEEPMLDPSLPQKRIEFPKRRKAAEQPVIVRPPREPSPVPVRALSEKPEFEPEPEPEREPQPPSPAPVVEPLARARVPEPRREAIPREEPSVRPQALPEARERPMSAWRVLLVTLLTAAASFALVRFLIVPSETPQGPVQASTAPPTVAAPPIAKKPKKVEAAPPAALTSQEQDLPADAAIDADKGLLEIDIGEKRAIYVDGTFVGLGPRRRVPLAPGKHEVKLRDGGDETTHAVEIRAGRSTRLSKSQP